MINNYSGGMAEWSCSGLQSRQRRFDSDSRLHYNDETTRPGGEIGRHEGLKILCPYRRAGSSPALGTIITVTQSSR